MNESLSTEQARKLILLSQRVLSAEKSGPAVSATQSAVEHLGYIQIDAISVIQRAHHHTLWNRNPRYKSDHLDQLVADKQIFEYWSHAAAYLPVCDYRFSLPRKLALVSGEQAHWFDRDERMIKLVLERIAAEGPLMAKDFDNSGKKVGEWIAKPAKRALEYLFMQGDLMVSSRSNFHKAFDFPERVLPGDANITPPSPVEYSRYLITRYLRANGLGQASEIAYLVKGVKPLITATLKEMTLSGELRQLRVAGDSYYALPASLELLDQPLARAKLKILSPFDNLIIQRKRIKELFGFDYQIECYVTQAKRRYGYFSLPILWDGSLVARIDCKVDRPESRLHIQHLALEPSTIRTEEFLLALRKELNHFMLFNSCTSIRIHRTSPANIKAELHLTLSDLIA